MIVPLFIAVLAAASTAQCQEVTETVTRCTTNYNMFPAPTGENIETALYPSPTTSSFTMTITSTTQDTITITPSATTFTDVVNVTSTFTTTVTSIPAATTISAPAGFFPLLNLGTPTATATATAAIGRHRRASIESRAEHLKRLPKTPAGNTGGFIVFTNGDGKSLNRMYPSLVECRVTVNVNSTETVLVNGPPKTEVLIPATATAVSTSTFTITETVTKVQPQQTEYAACQSNNVVNNVIGFDNLPVWFDRIVFQPEEGFPIANSQVINTTSATNCCIACQKTPYCAGSFYAPSLRACHLQLTEAAPSSSSPVPSLPESTSIPPFPLPSSNTSLSYPTASGAPYPAGNDTVILFPTATGLIPSGFSTVIPSATIISPSSVPASPSASAGPSTCPSGSMSLYLGRVYGQVKFPKDVAVYFSNGPCGRMGIDFESVEPATKELVARRMVQIGS